LAQARCRACGDAPALGGALPRPCPSSLVWVRRGVRLGASALRSVKGKAMVKRRPSKESIAALNAEKYPRTAALVTSQYFEFFITVMILGNCVTMGIEAETLLGKAKNFERTVAVSEHFFTAAFLIEFLLRLPVYGCRSFLPFVGSIWHFLDALLVLVSGVMVTWILPLCKIGDTGFVRTLTVLRAFRLVRLVRVVRKVELFHEVYMLLRGLTASIRTLFWTIVVVFFFTYVFAVFGVVLISVEIKDEYDDGASGDAELGSLVDRLGGILEMMFTLIQVLTLDSWNDAIARPLMNYIPWAWVFLYFYVSFAVWVLMNLVTAIIVENALTNSKKDEEQLLAQKERGRVADLETFRDLFERMDLDHDGQLTWEEFENAFEDPGISTKLRLLDFQQEDCHEVFQLLDTGDGFLSLQEFFEGITSMQGVAMAKEVFRILKSTEIIMRMVSHNSKEVLEDLGELLIHTPGAQVRERCGGLKSRSFGTNSQPTTPQIGGSAQSQKTSPSSALLQASQCIDSNKCMSRVAPLSQSDEAVAKVHGRLEELGEKVNTCSSSVAECSKKVDQMANDLADVKAGMALVLQKLAGQGPSEAHRHGGGREVRCCGPSSFVGAGCGLQK